MICVRKGFRVMKVSQSGVPLSRRFAFYDQIHTTGMDIKHRLSAHAAITLSKDMVFRDYAQGAFRMRGIGKGQTICVMIILKVQRLIIQDMSNCSGSNSESKSASLASQQAVQNARSAPIGGPGDVPLLRAICAWLIINSMHAEKLQFNLLCEQSIANVWRKQAYDRLQDEFGSGGSSTAKTADMGRRYEVDESN